MESKLNDYFGIQKKLLRPLGMPLAKCLTLKERYYSHFVYLMLIIYLCCMIPELFVEKELDELTNDLLFGTGYIVVTIKISTIIFNREKLNDILNTFEKGVFLPNIYRGGSIEQIWIETTVNFTRLLTIASTVVGLLCITACVIASYLIEVKKLPFGSLLLTKYCDYKWVLMFQSAASVMAMLQFMVVDVLYASILAHLCLQCEILQNAITMMINNSIRNAEKEENVNITTAAQIPWKYLEKEIKDVVIHHISIIKLSEVVEQVFNLPTLTVFTSMTLTLCFILYQGSIYPLLDFSFLRSFIILIAAMLPLCANSYWGTAIIIKSLAIADSCYEIDFVGTDVRFQKALILVLHRSQKSIKMTVGKFAPLSLVTMLAICKTSYSYFMLLRNVNEN